jgi:hypothetical protein
MSERGFGWAWMEPDESMRFRDASNENLGNVMRKSGLAK